VIDVILVFFNCSLVFHQLSVEMCQVLQKSVVKCTGTRHRRVEVIVGITIQILVNVKVAQYTKL